MSEVVIIMSEISLLPQDSMGQTRLRWKDFLDWREELGLDRMGSI